MERMKEDIQEETLRIMDYICRYGDARAYRKAQEIRKWHLQNTKSKSAEWRDLQRTR